MSFQVRNKLPQPATAALAPLAVSAKQCAAMLSISERLVWQLAKNNTLKTVRANSRVLFPVSGIEAFLNGAAADHSPKGSQNENQ